MQRLKRTTLVVLATLLISACAEQGAGSNCDKQISDMRTRYGMLADDFSRFESGGNTTLTFWYWKVNKVFIFSYGPDISGCKKSTYTRS